MKSPLNLSLPKLKAALKCQRAYKDGEFSANDAYNATKFKTDFTHAAFVAHVRLSVNGIMSFKAVTMKDVCDWIGSQSEYQNILILQK